MSLLYWILSFFAGFKPSLSVMVECQIVHARNLLIYIETVE